MFTLRIYLILAHHFAVALLILFIKVCDMLEHLITLLHDLLLFVVLCSRNMFLDPVLVGHIVSETMLHVFQIAIWNLLVVGWARYDVHQLLRHLLKLVLNDFDLFLVLFLIWLFLIFEKVAVFSAYVLLWLGSQILVFVEDLFVAVYDLVARSQSDFVFTAVIFRLGLHWCAAKNFSRIVQRLISVRAS